MIFDGTFIIGLTASKMLVDMSKKVQDKSAMETRSDVAKAYYLVLVSRENLRILDSTYINMNEILEQNKIIQALVFNVFLIALLPAFGEELFFRSALQGLFSRTMNVKLAVWIAAIIFSAIHFQFWRF